ncbi:hypothetical protein Dimus_021988 [Dionaea muscipula]
MASPPSSVPCSASLPARTATAIAAYSVVISLSIPLLGRLHCLLGIVIGGHLPSRRPLAWSAANCLVGGVVGNLPYKNPLTPINFSRDSGALRLVAHSADCLLDITLADRLLGGQTRKRLSGTTTIRCSFGDHHHPRSLGLFSSFSMAVIHS